MIKNLLWIIIILTNVAVQAKIPDIVAVVNEVPITKYEFIARKNMAIALNNIDNSDSLADKKLDETIINMLIDEELLNQQSHKFANNISEEEISQAIASIERQNNMEKGQLIEYIRSKEVSINSFKQKVRADLIRYHVVNSLSNTVSISPHEVDIAANTRDAKDILITTWQFTGFNSDEYTNKKIHALRSRLNNCDNIPATLYQDFAKGEKVTKKLSNFNGNTKSVLMDTKPGKASSVYLEDNKYKMLFVCTKKVEVSENYTKELMSFLSNEKMSRKAAKFFNDLRNQAYIKIML